METSKFSSAVELESEACKLIKEGYYKKAAQSLLKSIENFPVGPHSQENQSKLISLYLHSGDCQIRAGNFREAQNMCAKAREMINQDKSAFNKESGECFFLEGEIYKFLEDFPNSIASFNKALEATSKENILSILKVKNSLGEVKYYEGELEDAHEIFKEVLDTGIKNLGEENEVIARVYNNLANCWFDNNNETSLMYYRKSLESKLKVYGPDNPETALAYFNLAYWHSNLFEYEKSTELLLKAIEIYEKREICAHCDLAMCYKCLGNDYFHKGETLKGLSSFQKALKIKLKNPETMKGKLDLCLGDLTYHMSESRPLIAKGLSQARYNYVKKFMPEAVQSRQDSARDLLFLEEELASTREFEGYGV